MSNPGPMTMKDLAEHFHVSVATVSRALSDNPRISKERREAIAVLSSVQDTTPSS